MRVTTKLHSQHNGAYEYSIAHHIIQTLINENNWLDIHIGRSEIYQTQTVRQIITSQKIIKHYSIQQKGLSYGVQYNIISLVRQATPDINKSRQSTHIANKNITKRTLRNTIGSPVRQATPDDHSITPLN